MSQAEQLRQKAEDAEAKADAATNSVVKDAYLLLARYWREMARDAKE